ncbi:MAG: elongation factor P 5-aminopentanone reductase [Butyricicoccaceae bacterium]
MKKTVIITGASRGIGRACALKFAREDWNVVAGYASAELAAQSLCGEIRALGGECVIVQADVRDRTAMRRMVRLAQAHFGSVDAVVCNAGIAQQKLFSDLTEEDWDRMFDINVKGMYHLLQEVLPVFVGQQSGSAVLMSSMWGQVGASCEVHYSAAKAAVIGMTKALAKEYGLSGVRVNCVAPGVIDTDMNRHLGEAVMEELKEQTPLGTLGTPEDIAEAVYYLTAAPFVTGQVLGVNGGLII